MSTSFICEYCNKSYSSLSNLNYHRKTAKFCIEKRNSEKNKDEISKLSKLDEENMEYISLRLKERTSLY